MPPQQQQFSQQMNGMSAQQMQQLQQQSMQFSQQPGVFAYEQGLQGIPQGMQGIPQGMQGIPQGMQGLPQGMQPAVMSSDGLDISAMWAQQSMAGAQTLGFQQQARNPNGGMVVSPQPNQFMQQQQQVGGGGSMGVMIPNQGMIGGYDLQQQQFMQQQQGGYGNPHAQFQQQQQAQQQQLLDQQLLQRYNEAIMQQQMLGNYSNNGMMQQDAQVVLPASVSSTSPFMPLSDSGLSALNFPMVAQQEQMAMAMGMGGMENWQQIQQQQQMLQLQQLAQQKQQQQYMQQQVAYGNPQGQIQQMQQFQQQPQFQQMQQQGMVPQMVGLEALMQQQGSNLVGPNGQMVAANYMLAGMGGDMMQAGGVFDDEMLLSLENPRGVVADTSKPKKPAKLKRKLPASASNAGAGLAVKGPVTTRTKKVTEAALEATYASMMAEVEKLALQEEKLQKFKKLREQTVKQVANKMLSLWWNGDTTEKNWKTIAVDELSLTVPKAPYRCTVISQRVADKSSHLSRRLLGLQAILTDSACMHALLQLLGKRTPKGILKIDMSTEVDMLGEGANGDFMCSWRAYSTNAVLCGAVAEVETNGMFRFRFKGDAVVDLTKVPDPPPDDPAVGTTKTDGEQSTKRASIAGSETGAEKGTGSAISGTKRSGWLNPKKIEGLTEEPVDSSEERDRSRVNSDAAAALAAAAAKAALALVLPEMLLVEGEILFDGNAFRKALEASFRTRLRPMPSTVSEAAGTVEVEPSSLLAITRSISGSQHMITHVTQALADLIAGSAGQSSLHGMDLLPLLSSETNEAHINGNGVENKKKAQPRGIVPLSEGLINVTNQLRPTWVSASFKGADGKSHTVYAVLYPLFTSQPGHGELASNLALSCLSRNHRIEPVRQPVEHVLWELLIEEQSIMGTIAATVVEVCKFMLIRVEEGLAEPGQRDSICLNDMRDKLMVGAELVQGAPLASDAEAEVTPEGVPVPAEQRRTLYLLRALWKFYAQLELRFRQLRRLSVAVAEVSQSVEPLPGAVTDDGRLSPTAAPPVLIVKQPEDVKPKLVAVSTQPTDASGTLAAATVEISNEERVTRALMKIMRRWFCIGRTGVLVDCLFDVLQEAVDHALRATAQEFIWTSWIAHENEEVMRLWDVGSMHAARGNHSAVISTMHKASTFDPNFAEAHNQRSTALFMMGDIDSSMKAANKVLQLEPRHFGAMNGLAMMRMKQKKFKEALELLARVSELNPSMDVENSKAICLAGITETV